MSALNKNEIDWFELDTEKSDYSAPYGAYIAGNTLLEMPSGNIVVVGLCSCGSRESAEKTARENLGRRDKDRVVSKSRLLSWKK